LGLKNIKIKVFAIFSYFLDPFVLLDARWVTNETEMGPPKKKKIFCANQQTGKNQIGPIKFSFALGFCNNFPKGLVFTQRGMGIGC